MCKQTTQHMHCSHTIQSQQVSGERATRTKVTPQPTSVTVLHPHRNTSQSGKHRELHVLWRALACCGAAQWPERLLPLFPSLCSSLPSHNIKTVPLCLYPWQPASNNGGRELWPQHGRSMVPWRGKSKGEEDRGRWKAGTVTAEKGRVRESLFGSYTDIRMKMKEQSKGLNRRRKRNRWAIYEHIHLC